LIKTIFLQQKANTEILRCSLQYSKTTLRPIESQSHVEPFMAILNDNENGQFNHAWNGNEKLCTLIPSSISKITERIKENKRQQQQQ